MYICENWSLANMITIAYGLGPNQLSAPDWIGSALFNLSARLSAGTTWEQFQAMLQNVLADRFRLAVHRESRQRTGYQLLVAKGGPRFKASVTNELAELPTADSGDSAKKAQASVPMAFDRHGYPVFALGQSGTKMSGSRARKYEPRITMSQLAFFISQSLHEPVQEATGLAGLYEISLYWTVEDQSAAQPQTDTADPTGDNPTLLQALQEQLGLRMVRSGKIPFQVLVVDHSEKLPSQN
jgi:uncharacterized protein (TIGR03435 family)